jgi:excisionase family DNA binding protein
LIQFYFVDKTTTNEKMNQIILTGFTVNELLEKIGQVIDSKLSKVAPQQVQNQSAPYFTRQEVARLLKISLPTLNDYTKLGWLQSYKLGNRVLYKKEVVLASVEKLAANKYRKGGYQNA